MNHSCTEGILLSALLTASELIFWLLLYVMPLLLLLCIALVPGITNTNINRVVGAANAHAYTNINKAGDCETLAIIYV
jgi:hypothetical protein